MPTLLNVVVDSVVLHWLSLTLEDVSIAHGGISMAAGKSFGVFYADDVLFGLRYLEWLQGALNFLIGIFYRVVIMANVAKFRTVIFQTG